VTDETDQMIILWWHRSWPFRWLKFPVTMRVSSEIAGILNGQLQRFGSEPAAVLELAYMRALRSACRCGHSVAQTGG
jgi:hypothetical protein